MNIKLFSFATLLFFSALTQSIRAEHGLRIGLNYSSIDGENVKSDKWKWGYNIGFFQNLKLSNHFGVQVEASYCTKGGIFTEFLTEENSPNIIGERDDVFHYQYFEMPVFIKYVHHITNNNYFGLLAGVHVSYLIDAYDRQNVSKDVDVKEMEFDLRPETNEIDYGLILGIEYDFTLFHVPLFMDIRHNIGLRAIFKESDGNAEHHKLFSSSLGIRF